MSDASDATEGALQLRQLRPDARELTPEDFEKRYGPAFLVASGAELTAPVGPAATEVKLLLDAEPPAERTASLELLVYPVRRSDRSVGHLVTIGRTSNNDVVIRDISVSRFHAFVKEGEDGTHEILDAKSTNGTCVNGNPVPSQGNGPAVEVSAGDSVRLGQVELTFLDAPALQQFVLAHD